MVMGRKTHPTKLKIIKGTDRVDRINKNEPQPDVEIPQPPDFMSDYAREEWDRITHVLYDLGIISRIDRSALVGYCEAWGTYRDAKEKLKHSSIIIKTIQGNVQQSPLLSIANRASELMLKFAAEFGMTPAARAKVQAVDKKKNDNPFLKQA